MGETLHLRFSANNKKLCLLFDKIGYIRKC